MQRTWLALGGVVGSNVPDSDDPRARDRHLARIGQVLCLAGAVVGVLGLVAWLALPHMIPSTPGKRPMMPNTAIGLLLLGVGAAMRRTPRVGGVCRWGSLVISVLVIAMCGGMLGEYVFDVDLGMDGIVPSAGRSSPASIVALLLLGVALLTFDLRPAARRRPSEWCAVLAGAIAFTALTGLIFGVGELSRLTYGSFVGISLPTAVSVLLIVAGMLLERASGGMMRVVLSGTPGGTVLRGVVPLAIALPIVLGVVIMWVSSRLAVGGELSFVAPMLTAAMTVIGLVWTTSIAASLDRAHRALEASRAQTRDLVEHAPDGIFVAGVDGRCIDVNAAGARMLGCAREAIIGKTVGDLMLPEDRDRLEKARSRMLEGEVLVDEWLLRRDDGTRLPVEVRARILDDGRWQGVVRDITDRRQAEREQRLLAELGRMLVETLDHEATVANVASFAVRHLADLCVIDLIGGEASRKVAHRDPARSDACARLAGSVDPAHPLLIDAVLTTHRTFLVNQLDAELIRGDQRAWRALEPRSVLAIPLLMFERLLGAITLVASAGSRPFSPADVRLAEAFAHVAALSIESSMLYRTATRAVSSRDEVLAIVAHDLRNPLHTIDLQAELIRIDGMVHPADVIGRAVARMNRLIQDLLDVTRLEAGALSLEKQRVSVAQLVVEAAEVQRPLANAASLALELDLEDELPDVLADRDRILQILENLIGNSIKFTERDGRITVGVRSRDGEVVFGVADTGAGIPEEDQPHLFDRFWQAWKTRGRGAGLGLTIVKGLVEQHGGRIWVESKPGSGSAFYFTIPIAGARCHAPAR